MLKKHTKHTGHAQLQLDYHYKTADFKNSKGGKELIRKESGLPEGPGIKTPTTERSRVPHPTGS